MAGKSNVKWTLGKIVTRKEFIEIVDSLPSIPRKGKVDKIILHHTWSPTIADFKRISDYRHWFDVIDRFHKRKGYKKFGYHVLIFPDGIIALGRHLSDVGAHTVGQNANSVGVCMLGNFDVELPEPEQWSSTKVVLAKLLSAYGLKPKDIYFHRDFASKTCPGTKIDKEYVRYAVEQTLKFLRR